ncbi:MAG TPA: hypothetical protein VFT29_10250 [Gemmatimonadaceae bacterium]|nr:hypothetical protein [Gemmatimonadaceae bacterium]
MSDARHSSWIPAALLAGLVYVVIGRAFPVPAGSERLWRLLAWLASLVVFGVHFGYERLERRAPLTTALHSAVGVAIGGFGLAAYAAVRELMSTSAFRPIWIFALVAWPAITGVPAFLVAFVVATALERVQRKVDTAASGV